MRIVSTQQERANRVEALRVYPASQDKGEYVDNLSELVYALKQAKSVKQIKDSRFPKLWPLFVQRKDGSQSVFFLSTSRSRSGWADGNERAENLVNEAADLLMSKGIDLPAAAKTVLIASFITFTPVAKSHAIAAQMMRKAGIGRAFTVVSAAPPTGAGAILLGGWLCRFAETGAVLVGDAISNFSLKVWAKAADELKTSLLHLEVATKPMTLLQGPSRTSYVLLGSQKLQLDPKRVKDGRSVTNDFKMGMKTAVQKML